MILFRVCLVLIGYLTLPLGEHVLGEEKPPRADQYGDPLPAGAVVRLGTVRFRHEGWVHAVAFSPDGKILAARTKLGVVLLWDARTGRELRRLKTPRNFFLSDCSAIDFSPDSRFLAAMNGEEHVGFWEVATGKQVRTLPLPKGAPGRDTIRSFRISPDGQMLAVGGDAHTYLLDVTSGKVLRQLTPSWHVAFSPDGATLALATPRQLELWNIATGQLLRSIEGHRGFGRFFSALAFSPDGKLVATGTSELIVVSEVATGKTHTRIEAKMGYVKGLAFTPDGKTLLSGGDRDDKVRFWDLASGRERLQVPAGLWGLHALALSRDGRTVAAGGVNNMVHLWDVATGKELFTEFEGHDTLVYAVAFSPDGKLLASGADNQQIRLWDPRTGKHVRQLTGHSAWAVAFSPDGRRLASVYNFNTTACLWDVATGEVVLKLSPPGTDWSSSDQVNRGLAFSPDGKTLLTADHQRTTWGELVGTARLHLWEAATGRHIREFRIPQFRLRCLALAPDGRTVALGGSRKELRLYDLATGQEVRALHGHEKSVDAVAFSPDSEVLASGSSDGTVRLWQAATGKEILKFRGYKDGGDAVAFSPDGQVVASASDLSHARDFSRDDVPESEIQIWEVASGRQLAQLQGYASDVTSLTFSPDGRRLASGLRNSTVLIWDLACVTGAAGREATDLRPKELDDLWAALAETDAGKAHQAIWVLAQVPEKAVPFLRNRLRPAVVADLQRIRRLIADLDSDTFAVRQAAFQELEELGERAESALRQALEGKPPLEVRRRVEVLLSAPGVIRSAEVLRRMRAIQTLERIGCSEAQQVLTILAEGAPAARETQHAKAALWRLARRLIATQLRP